MCNRLNLLLIDRPAYDRLWPVAEKALQARDITPSLPPHDHPLGHEWALDAGAEAHVTVASVDGPVDAAATATRETSGLAATVCATDRAAAEAFVDAYTGTGVFWNASTRLLDGYKLLGLPETGINVDHTPGPARPRHLPRPVAAPVRRAAPRLTGPDLARGAAEPGPERPAEVRRVDEPPGERQVADRPVGEGGIAQVGPDAVETLGPDPLRDRARLARRRRGAAC